MSEYCCAMRDKFLVGIVAVNPDVPEPSDLIDFIDFDVVRGDKKPVIKIRFCPFCSKAIAGPFRMIDPPKEG